MLSQKVRILMPLVETLLDDEPKCAHTNDLLGLTSDRFFTRPPNRIRIHI